MNPVRETTWLLKSSLASGELVELAGSDFQVEMDSSTTSDMTVYDDFDAHLLSADHVLCRLGRQRFQLISGFDRVEEVRASPGARFWWDFPDGEIKDRLKSLIGLRAVLPVFSMKMVRTPFFLRDGEEKIVAKGQLLQFTVNDGDRHCLMLREMRGYEKSFVKAGKVLKPVLEREVPESGLGTLLGEQNRIAGRKESVEPVHLTADMLTEDAVRAMAVGMLDEAVRHVDGIVADIDTVFLHRFRISVRKLRSLVGLLKKSLPSESVAALTPRLSAIAGSTGRLRDLDVFLLERETYRAMLPDSQAEGLDELYALVGKQRRREKTRVARYLRSGRFREDMDVCRTELSAAPAYRTDMSSKPVLATARSLLLKRYGKIQAMSERLDSHSTDEDVHDIRKEFKKLRYLIEFFMELLPERRTTRLLSRLKKMQSTLGQFNDYCIQIESLSSFMDDSRIEMTKALGGLIAILHHHQVEARDRVEAALARFFTEEMSLEIRSAFGAKAGGESR